MKINKLNTPIFFPLPPIKFNTLMLLLPCFVITSHQSIILYLAMYFLISVNTATREIISLYTLSPFLCQLHSLQQQQQQQQMKLDLISSLLVLSTLGSSLVLPQEALNIDSIQSPQSPQSLPLVNSTELQSLITEDALRAGAEHLYELAGYSNSSLGHPSRVIGSRGHWATIAYIKSELNKLEGYFNVSIQPFKAFMSEIYAVNATVNGIVPESLTEMDMSPPTPGKTPVVGRLVLVKNSGCHEEDYADVENGTIALVKRGECAFGDKAEFAAKFGAHAAIIYNNEEGSIRGTLGVPKEGVDVSPCVGVGKKEGEKFAAQIEAGEELVAEVYVDSFVGPITTVNVIAETVEGDPENVVMLGAHSDSVTAGPGINDDGSGTISLLEVAKQLSKFNVRNKVRFAWWAAEEEGLLGSNYYAENLSVEENLKIRLFMDYDMMASPNYEYEVYDGNNTVNPEGSEEIKQLYIEYYTSHGHNYTLIPFDGRSDYVGFIEHGIPGGGVAAGAEKKNFENGKVLDRCYHQLCDDVSNIAWDAFLVNTRLIAHSVATYGADLSIFPKRVPVDAATSSLLFAYRGDKLVF